MPKQKLLIITLAVSLAAIFTWFVIIDNYIIPTIQQEITNSYQNGYETGANDIITGIIQQSYSCQPVSVWSENDTVQLINVACLQSPEDISENNTP